MLSGREGWERLRAFITGTPRVRLVLILGLVWLVLHLAGFIYFATTPSEGDSPLPAGGDLFIYRDAGQNFLQRAQLYDMGPGTMKSTQNFRYHPIFAMVMSWLGIVPVNALVVLWFSGLLAAYLGGLLVWMCLFSRLPHFDWSAVGIAVVIPLVAFDWVASWGYGNTNSAMVLVSGLLALALIDRRWGWAGVLTALILLLKFYWCFPLLLLVVFREWRALVRVLLIGAGLYIGVTALYVVLSGDPSYAWARFVDSLVFLAQAGARYPWQGSEAMFNSQQYSIYQTILRYFGFVSWAGVLTACLQVLAVGVLALRTASLWRSGIGRDKQPEYGLLMVLLGYVVAMLCLSEVQDTPFAGLICVFLWAFARSRPWAKVSGVIAFLELPTLIGLSVNVTWLIIPDVVPVLLISLLALYIGGFILSAPAEVAQANLVPTRTA